MSKSPKFWEKKPTMRQRRIEVTKMPDVILRSGENAFLNWRLGPIKKKDPLKERIVPIVYGIMNFKKCPSSADDKAPQERRSKKTPT